MGLFTKKKSKKIITQSSDVVKTSNVRNDRPDHRKTLRVGDKDYYLSVRELENAPLNLTLTLDDIETNKVFCVLTIDLGDKQIAHPDEYIPLYCAYLDTKHNTGVFEFLKNHHICDIFTNADGCQYGWEPYSDSKYPLCVFSFDALKQYDYDGIVKYDKNYRKEYARLLSLPSSYYMEESYKQLKEDSDNYKSYE